MVFVMALKIVRFFVKYKILLISINKIGTVQRFCQNNGTWAPTVSSDIQCETCFGDSRPVKVKRNFYFYNF